VTPLSSWLLDDALSICAPRRFLSSTLPDGFGVTGYHITIATILAGLLPTACRANQ